jgi:hypothetical protein
MGNVYGFDAIERFRQAIRQKAGALPLLGRGLRAFNEAASYPIMQQLVPKAKMGAWARMAAAELERLPANATPEQARQVLYRQWQSVENRMGQVTYDNLFWNRTLRDVMHMAVRSVGWNAGDIGEFGGAVADLPSSAKGLVTGKGISPRLAYAVALPIVAGINGALLQYLMTGKPPEEPKDLFFPKTGQKRQDDTDDRLSMPTYMRDFYALANRADEGPLPGRGKRRPRGRRQGAPDAAHLLGDGHQRGLAGRRRPRPARPDPDAGLRRGGAPALGLRADLAVVGPQAALPGGAADGAGAGPGRADAGAVLRHAALGDAAGH